MNRSFNVGGTYTFTFTGWKAWVVLALILYVAHARHADMEKALPEATNMIRASLAGEYMMAELNRQKAVGEVVGFDKMEVTFAEVTTRGGYWGDPTIRVKPLLNGAPPPDGREYRYYDADYSWWVGFIAPFEIQRSLYFITD
ncbi:MAG: hypothetical protein HQK87_08755 [Nitrospinae bacterium]|nr:hypothetical protein [Nitrospinota bacterium]